MFLLDTNIIGYLMKGTFPHLTEKVLSIPPSKIAVSAFSVFEMEYGAMKKGWGERLRNQMYVLISPFSIVPFNAEDAIAAGQIRADLAKRGEMIGAYDVLIAAQGISRGMTVVTHNTREFGKVPNIVLEDWAE